MIFKVCKREVKCTLVQVLRLCTGRTAHRGSRDIVILFHDHGTRRRSGVSVTPRPLFTRRKDPVPIVQEGGPQGRSGQVAESLAPTGIRSLEPSARNQSVKGRTLPKILTLVWVLRLLDDGRILAAETCCSKYNE